MQNCTKKISLFLLIVFFKGLILSTIMTARERPITYQEALNDFHEYYYELIRRHKIDLPQDELKQIQKTGDVLLTAHSDDVLTQSDLSKVKRDLKNYLKMLFPKKFARSPRRDTLHFKIAKRAIKFSIRDFIVNRLGVTDSIEIGYLWHSVRDQVINRLIYKSAFDHHKLLVINHEHLKKIYQKALAAVTKNHERLLKNKKVLLKKYKARRKKKKSVQTPGMTLKQRTLHQHHQKHPTSMKKARKHVKYLLQYSGIDSVHRKDLLEQTMAQLDRYVVKGKVDHYTMKKIAHDVIKSFKKKSFCKICRDFVKASNRRRFECGHTTHKTCMFKNYGSSAQLSGPNAQVEKDCPICVKRRDK